MILHLITDEKFSDYAIKQFEGEEMCSEFVVISHNEQLKRINSNIPLRIIDPDSNGFNGLIASLTNYRAIILHGLFWPWQERILREVPDSTKIGWVFWGGDIYGRQDINQSFLSKHSKTLNNCHDIVSIIKGRKPIAPYEIPHDLLNRIDYCLTDIHEDFEYVSKYVGKEFKELWYNYYSIEETIGELKNAVCAGENILLGNSSTLECNHLDGIYAIRKAKIKYGKVFIPLSYGHPWVRQYIRKAGDILLKGKMMALCDFLPLAQYNKTILSCSAVIMPHYRPQAFGNIITSLWLGCRVYLSERSLLYAFLKRIGCRVFSIESDEISCVPVTEYEREENRAILSSLYSYDRMREKNIELVKELKS